MFNCEVCNYETNIKHNYDRHLKSKRHLNFINFSPSIVHQLSISSPSIYDCQSCNKTFSSQSSLSKHHKTCMFIKNNELNSQLKEKTREVQDKTREVQDKTRDLELIK